MQKWRSPSTNTTCRRTSSLQSSTGPPLIGSTTWSALPSEWRHAQTVGVNDLSSLVESNVKLYQVGWKLLLICSLVCSVLIGQTSTPEEWNGGSREIPETIRKSRKKSNVKLKVVWSFTKWVESNVKLDNVIFLLQYRATVIAFAASKDGFSWVALHCA